MKETQCQRILKYLHRFGSITSALAMADLGCMRLASRINDLKKMGIPIKKRTAVAINRYGERVHFAEYYIEEEA